MNERVKEVRAMTNFTVKVEPRDDSACVLALAGEVDPYTAPEFEHRLIKAIENGGRVVVDLTEASFIDSSFLAALTGAQKRLNGRGQISIVCSDQNLAKVFEITGLHRLFAIEVASRSSNSFGESGRAAAPTTTGRTASWRDRHARNQALFREVNEQIEQLNDSLNTDGKDRVLCECGNPECTQLIELTRAEYDRVREHASRFLVALNHENSEMESTVEQNERFAVVQSHTRAP